jgi:hypothetical protein
MRGKKHIRNLNRSRRPPRGAKLPRQKLFEPVIETLSGINVRSSYEKACADLFYQNNIKFQYEPLMLLEGRKFRPDFFLPDFNLFVEICGYNHQPYYRDRINYKKQIYDKNGLNAVFIDHDGGGGIDDRIRGALQPHGLNFDK